MESQQITSTSIVVVDFVIAYRLVEEEEEIQTTVTTYNTNAAQIYHHCHQWKEWMETIKHRWAYVCYGTMDYQWNDNTAREQQLVNDECTWW